MPESRNGEIARLELLFAAHPEGRVFTHLAEAYRRAGDTDRAHELLENGLARHGDYPSAHVVMGRVLLDLGRSEDADRAFRRALELDPHNLVALRALADIARAEGRTAQAREYYRTLIELDPFDDEYAEILAGLHAPEPAPDLPDAADPGPAAASADIGGPGGSEPPVEELDPPEPAAGEILDVEDDIVEPAFRGAGDLEPEPWSASPFAPGWPEAHTQEESMSAGAEAAIITEEPAGVAPEVHGPEDPPGDMSDPGHALAAEHIVEHAPEPARVIAAAAEPGPEPAVAPTEPGPPGDGVVTETLAELYLSQGLTTRAIEVYEALLRRRPGDARLIQRLERARARAAQHTDAPAPARTEAGGASVQTSEMSVEEGAALQAALEPATGPEPASPIDVYFQGLLDWKPAIRTPSTNGRHPAPVDLDATAEPARDTAHAEIREPEYDDAFATPAPADTTEPVDADAPDAVDPPELDDDFDALFAPAPAARVDEPDPAPAPAAEPAMPVTPPALPARSGLVGLAGMLVGLLEQSGTGGGASGLTRELATAIGRELGLDNEALESLALAALLRGLGRIAPGGATKAEAAGDDASPHDLALTLELLGGVPLPDSVRDTLRWSAARWDGHDAFSPADATVALAHAVPDRDLIPRAARILAVADAFATLVAPDRDRAAERVAHALARIEEDAGRRFDPDAVAALVRVVRGHPVLGIPRRVLVVEAGLAPAAVAATRLRTSGFQPRVVPGLSVARERLAEGAADALMIGGALPAADLEYFLAEVRADPGIAAAPIVVTGVDDLDRRIAFLAAGADLCFPTTTAPNEVSAALTALLRRAAAAERSAAAVPAPPPPQPEPRPEHAPVPAPHHALEGDLAEFPLSWLLRVMDYDGRTAAIHVAGAAGNGVVYVENGAAIHARTDRLSGEDALRDMLGWSRGTFHLRHGLGPDRRTIHRSLVQILIRPPDG